MNNTDKQDLIEITFPQRADDSYFATEFYREVQLKMREGNNRNLSLDFSSCAWINPIVLMAMLCELELWASRNPKFKVICLLGTVSDAKPARVSLLFMSQFGFLESIARIGTASRSRKSSDNCTTFYFKRQNKSTAARYSAAAIRVLQEHIGTDFKHCNIDLTYPDSQVCPPALFAPRATTAEELKSSIDDALRFVKERIHLIDDCYFQGRSSDLRYRDVTLQRIRLTMTELVVNSIEHGYPDESDEPRATCVFARFLHGTKRPECTFNTTEEFGQYIQLFVVDVGRGITSDRSLWLETTELQNPEDLAAIKDGVDSLFRLPVSRRKRTEVGRGSITGLQNIDFVLGHYNERTAVAVDGYISAFQHGQSARADKRPFPSGSFPRGTFFDVGIGLALPPDLDSHWFKPQGQSNKIHEIREYAFGSVKSSIIELPVLELEGSNRYVKVSGDASLANWFSKKLNSGEGDSIVVRSTRDLQKTALLVVVGCWLRAIVENSKESRRFEIFFADLSSSQALFLKTLLLGTPNASQTADGRVNSEPGDIYAPLRHVFPRSGSISNATSKVPAEVLLHLITEQSEASTVQIRLTSSEDLPGSNSTFTHYSFAPYSQSIETHVRALKQCLGALARHDGRIFAQWLQTAEGVQQEMVVWERELLNVNDSSSTPTLILPTYINYPLISQDRTISKLIRKALRRAISLFPELRPIAIDELIASDFADATLRLNRSKVDLQSVKSPTLFVISALVSKQTIYRQEKAIGSAKATLACFIVPSYSVKSEEYVEPSKIGANIYSLFELPKTALPADFPLFNIGHTYWERIPVTPYIKPFVATSIDGHGESKSERDSMLWGGAKSRSESYIEWSSPRVMKLGHWAIDHRHGLIELNYDVCLGRQADEHSSFYTWLADQLAPTGTEENLTPSNERRLLIIYPVSRRNGMIVRHLKRMPKVENVLGSLQFIPVSFLPDIGDGLKMLTPLSVQQVRNAAKSSLNEAVFLDIGFVGNRTFRHTARQVRACGVDHVTGIGLLNRTSFPGLDSEARQISAIDGVKCYWRLEVPTLDDARSCPICRSLSELRTLSQYIGSTRTALNDRLLTVIGEWQLHRTSDSWQEHGIAPTPLIVSGSEEGALSLQKTHERWGILVENSAQAAAFAIETARVTSEQDFPIRYAQTLSRCRQFNAALEVLAAYLVLCSHDISLFYVERIVETILQLLAEIEPPSRNSEIDAQSPLRSLAVVSICGLETKIKTLLQPTFLKLIATAQIRRSEQILIGYALRLVDEIAYSKLVEGLLSTADPESVNNVRRNETLLWNEKSPPNRHLARARSFFGAGNDHGTLKGWLDSATSVTSAKSLCELAATYVWRTSTELNPVFSVLFKDGETFLRDVARLAKISPEDKSAFRLRDDFVFEVVKALSVVRREFQACYLRIDGSEGNFERLFSAIRAVVLEIKDLPHGKVFIDLPSFRTPDKRIAKYPYALIGNTLHTAIISVVLSAYRKGRLDSAGKIVRISLRPPVEGEVPLDYIVVEFSNYPGVDADPQGFLSMKPLLSDYYAITDISPTTQSFPSQRRIGRHGEFIVSLCVKLYQGGD